MRKLKFFTIGLVPGLLLVFFILNKKGAKCSGYLPNSRVLAETLSKKFEYSPTFQADMAKIGVTEDFLRDSIVTEGKIDFDRSHAQKKPCPDYFLAYPKEHPKFQITFEKCEKQVTFQSISKLK